MVHEVCMKAFSPPAHTKVEYGHGRQDPARAADELDDRSWPLIMKM